MTEQVGSGGLPTNAWLGPYQVLGLLGAGGMGAVYKARDSRLDRLVALKVLPERFADDPARRERFEREARAVAALNHPHICQLYDVGSAEAAAGVGPQRFLVMEYLEGRSLEDRLLAGPLPIAEALRIAIDLAGALDHAHRRGLVHRDLKPANVMLTTGGAGPASSPQAKLLDFGISRLQAPADLPALETVTEDRRPLTAEGAVLGTYPYMAPEQLAGHDADARSDIFAFGAVLYEMITGQRAFQGTTAATLIGAILHSEPPPIAARQPLAPPALDRIVARCLAKDPDNRWQTARDLALELQWIAEHPASDTPARPAASRRWRPIRWAAVSALLTAALILVPFVYLPNEPAGVSAVQLEVSPPKGVILADPRVAGPVAISPDGRLLAFVAMGADRAQRIWVRPLDSANARALAGTDGAVLPFWSPDSRDIGFFAQRKLKRVAATGGVPQTLHDAIQPGGGTWAADGTILFAAELGFQLYRGSADGGIATVVPADGLNRERWSPSFLPDGRRYVYFGRPQQHGVYLGSLDSSSARPLLKGFVSAVFAPPAYLLAIRGSTKSAENAALFAQRLDLSTFETIGDPTLVAEPATYSSAMARAAFTASTTGTLVFSEIEDPVQGLIWFDRGGNRLGQVGGSASNFDPTLSPDDTSVVFARPDPDSGSPDLWLIDLARGTSPRLTYDERQDFSPAWSPNGSRIVFAAQPRGAPPNLFQKTVRDGGAEELLVKAIFNSQPTDWSRDGGFVIYARRDPRTQYDLWVLSISPGAERQETLYFASPGNEHQAQFSPDGTRVAYTSDESGTNEVYVDTFPKPATREQISTGGGIQPRWRADGRELFYLSLDGRMMSVSVDSGPGFRPGIPAPLFPTRIFDPYSAEHSIYQRGVWNYDVARDGQRFLIATPDSGRPVPTTAVLLNWFARLPRP
jgi:serine/threonine protein kinase/Tol biopolymer transport system component